MVLCEACLGRMTGPERPVITGAILDNSDSLTNIPQVKITKRPVGLSPFILRASGGQGQVTSPRQRQRPAAITPMRDDPLLGSDGPVWPPLLRLWTYSTLCGALAIVLGRVTVSVTRTALPGVPDVPVRLVSVVAVVVATGLAAEHVLSHLKGLITRHRS